MGGVLGREPSIHNIGVAPGSGPGPPRGSTSDISNRQISTEAGASRGSGHFSPSRGGGGLVVRKGSARVGLAMREPSSPPPSGLTHRPVRRYAPDAGLAEQRDDAVAIEEPLDIRVNGDSVALTMRSPAGRHTSKA